MAQPASPQVDGWCSAGQNSCLREYRRFSLPPEKAAERVTMIREQGFAGTKWFFRRGIGDGLDGERRISR